MFERLSPYSNGMSYGKTSIVVFCCKKVDEPWLLKLQMPPPLNWLLPTLTSTGTGWRRQGFTLLGRFFLHVKSALIHPTAVVKTRVQVAGTGFSHLTGFSVFRHIIRRDDIRGIFRGFGTSAIGSVPGRVLALTSFEVSMDMTLKYTEGLDMPEATRIAVANGVSGMVSNLSSVYFVPLEEICQRLMVQGLPGTKACHGPFDVVCKVIKAEGLRGLYRGFGLTIITQSPASALW